MAETKRKTVNTSNKQNIYYALLDFNFMLIYVPANLRKKMHLKMSVLPLLRELSEMP